MDGVRDYFLTFFKAIKQSTTSRDIFISECYFGAILQYLTEKMLRILSVFGRRPVQVFHL